MRRLGGVELGWQHPLAWLALCLATKLREIDVTTLSLALGAPSTPKGTRAYRIVAADVLMTLADQGLLERHGDVGERPEDGGHWYRYALHEEARP